MYQSFKAIRSDDDVTIFPYLANLTDLKVCVGKTTLELTQKSKQFRFVLSPLHITTNLFSAFWTYHKFVCLNIDRRTEATIVW